MSAIWRLGALAMVCGALAACDGPDSGPGPFADLGEDQLLVRFLPNPDAHEGMCNPLVQYAVKTNLDALQLRTTYLLGPDLGTGSSFALRDDDGDGIATGREPVSMFDGVEGDCAQTFLRIESIFCESFSASYPPTCSELRVEGADHLMSVTQAP